MRFNAKYINVLAEWFLLINNLFSTAASDLVGFTVWLEVATGLSNKAFDAY